MSFIQFESGREKDKLRQELREAREQMLETAKKNAQLREERAAQKELTGEKNWILPSVANKIEKLSKVAKVKKAKKKKDKHVKGKKKSKKRSLSSDSESTDEEQRKSRKKSKRTKSKRSRRRHDSSSDSDESSSDSEECKIRKKKSKKRDTSSSSSSTEEKQEEEWVERAGTTAKPSVLQRDDWMTNADALMLKTFSRDRVENKPNEKQQIDTYDPAKSTRELNPYWKSTGTGLPAFQKPRDDSDEEVQGRQRVRASSSQMTSASRSWQKKTNNEVAEKRVEKSSHNRRSPTPSSDSASSTSEDTNRAVAKPEQQTNAAPVQFLTDQQMNELGAKLLKAEIMGNMELADDLKQKLEQARLNRVAVKERKQAAQSTTQVRSKGARKEEEEHVLLTHTDERGNTRPLAQSRSVDPRDLYGGRKGARKQKRVDTHVDGERVRYFADDDKYDIKQMFEREKYTTAADANLQYANIAGQHKNPNDDLDDIFADKIRKNIDKESTDQKELQRAIHEHKNLSAQLDNCDKCLDADKMDKKLLVCMGEKVYLSLPWHTGLQPGHCLIVPTQHVSCCTQLDEDTWEEVNNFRKALTRMFAAQRKDVIFFEIANKLQRRPHLSIHCVPVAEAHGEMAPFYFKKAIEESEREWSVNKQLVSLRNKGLRSCIPKGLPYFWVNFGMDSGFAHVIEDQDRFPANFALEIIGGLLHLDANKWRKPQKEQNIIAKVKMFADGWKKYDCTE